MSLAARPRRLAWALALGLAALMLCLPGRARAQEPEAESAADAGEGDTSWCTTAEALLELAPEERRGLQAMCKGEGPAQADAIAAALRLGGWRGAFVARLASERGAGDEREALIEAQRKAEARVKALLDKQLTTRGKAKRACADLHAGLLAALKDYAEAEGEVVVLPPSLELLGEDAACVLEGAGADPRAGLTTDWRLLTYAGARDDVLRVWIVDERGDAPIAYEAAPITYDEGGYHGQLVLVPKGKLAAVEVEQAELDVPWSFLQYFNDDFTVGRKDDDCLTLEVSTDADPESGPPAPDWSLIVDGGVLRLPVVAKDPRSKLRRRILKVARGDHDVAFVAEGEAGEGIEPWASALAEDTNSRREGCRTVSYDLRGLSNTKRYGVAQIRVDQSCRDRGILPARVRRYVEVYGKRGDTTVVPLDAWAEAMEVFRELEQRLGASPDNARGASRGELDDRKEMAALAEEVMRLGVNSLFYFDMRCGEAKYTLVGKRVELSEFARQPKAAVTGPDTDELLLVRSYEFSADRMREAFELVLGDLLDRPHVRFVGLPTRVEQGRAQELQVVGFQEAADSEISLRVVALRGGSRNSSVCEGIDEINRLASYAPLENSVEAITRKGARSGRVVITKSSAEDDKLTAEIGGLPGGLYVAVAEYGDALAASCFEVVDRDFEGFVRIGGFSQWRTALPGRDSLRRDQIGYLRVNAGGRYTYAEFFEFGAELGYEFTEYSTDVIPNWDLLATNTNLIDDDGRLPLSWKRHGLLLGAFAGARMPFGRCVYLRPKPGDEGDARAVDRCRPVPAEAFIDVHLYANLGFLDTSGLPATFVNSSAGADATLDPNLDAALLTGVRVRPRPALSVSVFGGLVFSDFARGDGESNSVWSDDRSLRAIFGFEVGWALAMKEQG